MKKGVKIAIAGGAGILLAVALSKMAEENEVKTASNNNTEPLDETQLKALQAAAQPAAQTAAQLAVTTNEGFVVVPLISYKDLGAEPGDTQAFRKYLLDFISTNYPQVCNFVGIYEPNFKYGYYGYKYATKEGGYMVVKPYGFLNHPPQVTTFGYYNGVYFEN